MCECGRGVLSGQLFQYTLDVSDIHSLVKGFYTCSCSLQLISAAVDKRIRLRWYTRVYARRTCAPRSRTARWPGRADYGLEGLCAGTVHCTRVRGCMSFSMCSRAYVGSFVVCAWMQRNKTAESEMANMSRICRFPACNHSDSPGEVEGPVLAAQMRNAKRL